MHGEPRLKPGWELAGAAEAEAAARIAQLQKQLHDAHQARSEAIQSLGSLQMTMMPWNGVQYP